LKIVFVITNSPPLVGGLEKACLRLAQKLQDRGQEVQILARFTMGRHNLAGYFQDRERPNQMNTDKGPRTTPNDTKGRKRGAGSREAAQLPIADA